jgi:hypothetical protein
MDGELEAMVARVQDPGLIPGIYNYCDRRCSRCPFTKRCFSFREGQHQAQVHGDRDLCEEVGANFELAGKLMQAWCEHEGIDFSKIEAEAKSAAADREMQRANHLVDSDPLYARARQYTHAAYDVVEPLSSLSPFHGWPPEVTAAIADIEWYAGMISAKIGRALHGAAEQREWPDDDPIQNDWNGSAKAARLAIAQSRGAWESLFAAGQTPREASIRATATLLAEIDRELAERFPQAMDFIRPGFDEPDVAAGALTSLAPFEPRRRTLGQRLRGWLVRTRGRLGLE